MLKKIGRQRSVWGPTKKNNKTGGLQGKGICRPNPGNPVKKMKVSGGKEQGKTCIRKGKLEGSGGVQRGWKKGGKSLFKN